VRFLRILFFRDAPSSSSSSGGASNRAQHSTCASMPCRSQLTSYNASDACVVHDILTEAERRGRKTRAAIQWPRFSRRTTIPSRLTSFLCPVFLPFKSGHGILQNVPPLPFRLCLRQTRIPSFGCTSYPPTDKVESAPRLTALSRMAWMSKVRLGFLRPRPLTAHESINKSRRVPIPSAVNNGGSWRRRL